MWPFRRVRPAVERVEDTLSRRIGDKAAALRGVDAEIQARQAMTDTLNRLISYEMKESGLTAKSIEEYQGWLGKVRALDLEGYIETAKTGMWEELREGHPPVIVHPDVVMHRVKDWLRNRLPLYLSDGHVGQRDGLSQEILDLRSTMETLGYSRQSVELTRTNILLTILIPIAIFLSTMFATLIVEAFGTEITTFIRGLFGK